MARPLLAFIALAVSMVWGTAPAKAEPSGEIVEMAVTFDVENTNRSKVPCASDGNRYEIGATIVGPDALLKSGRVPAGTLYVHGLGLSSYVWRFGDVPGYDHAAEMARLGHVSVVYDRLGYGDSPKPNGLDTCYGSEADVVDQLVRALKSGAYEATAGARPPVFEKVVVLGHSQAGLIVQPFAYSFTSHDGLGIVSWANEGNRPAVTEEASDTAQTCLTGGEQADDGERPPFYAFYPDDDATFRAFYFHDAEPAVIDAAIRRQEPDPCGNGGSLAQTVLVDETALGDIGVPVLLAYGMEDGYRPQPSSGEEHAAKFSGSPSVALEFIADSGNALPLERTAPEFRAVLARWLCTNGFAARPNCPPSGDPSSEPDTGSTDTAEPDADRLPATGGASTGGWIPVLAVAMALVRFRER